MKAQSKLTPEEIRASSKNLAAAHELAFEKWVIARSSSPAPLPSKPGQEGSESVRARKQFGEAAHTG